MLSCSAQLQSLYYVTQAIERGNFKKMKDSIQKMKEVAGACPSADDYLDVYYLQSVVSKRKGKRTLYYVTLLAYSAIHNEKGMLELLISEGASMFPLLTLFFGVMTLYVFLCRPSLGQQYDRISSKSSFGVFAAP